MLDCCAEEAACPPKCEHLAGTHRAGHLARQVSHGVACSTTVRQRSTPLKKLAVNVETGAEGFREADGWPCPRRKPAHQFPQPGDGGIAVDDYTAAPDAHLQVEWLCRDDHAREHGDRAGPASCGGFEASSPSAEACSSEPAVAGSAAIWV